MEYDPLKNRLEKVIALYPSVRKLIFHLFRLFFLRQRYVFKEINNLFENTDKIRLYDAGAGFCQYSDFILANWKNSISFATDLKTDYLKSYAKYAAEKYPGRFFYKSADLQTYLPAHKYDLSLAIDILEHIEDDVSTLKNILDALKPNGYLIISTPSNLDKAAEFTSEHIRSGYNKQELENKLQQVGFRIVKSIYTYGPFGSLSWKLMLKFPMQLIQKKLFLFLPVHYLLVYPIGELFMRLDMQMKNKQGTGILLVAQKPED